MAYRNGSHGTREPSSVTRKLRSARTRPGLRGAAVRASMRMTGAGLLMLLAGAAVSPARPQDPEAAASPSRSVLDGVFTPGQAESGELKFSDECESCHRTNEFAGALFRRSWAGKSARELFDLIATTMPEGDPGGLRPNEYASILAFIFSANNYPAGELELPADLFELDRITIESP